MKYLSCIALDVSKDSSHIGVFNKDLNILSKVVVINHDLEGFSNIIALIETFPNSIIVFEATGVYHRGLQKFLIDHSMPYVIINPLVSAKIRKQSLRSIKTDKKDCRTIAKAYFVADDKDTLLETIDDSSYYQMRQLSRYYEDSLVHLVKAKVSFNATLDIVYPGFKKAVGGLYTQSSIAIITKYKHPDNIKSKSPRTIAVYLMKATSCSEIRALSLANKLIQYSKNCCSGCSVTDINCDILVDLLGTVQLFILKTESILEQLIQLAMKSDYYESVRSIPGVGDNLASRIIAEIGDIKKFPGSRQLIAYAGTDPHIYQSGVRDGHHLSISKKGNKILRKTLYLATTCHLRIKTENNTVIKEFYTKKKQQGKPGKVAHVASMNKLLKVIYSVSINNSIFN